MRDYDVIMLQETHLRPEQEMQLQVPLQYNCLALSRPQTRDFMHGGAGLLTIYRSDLALMDVTPAYQHEFIAVRIGDAVLLSVYLPPPSSPWLENYVQPVEQSLRELVHHFVEVQGLRLIAMGDFNARVGTLSLGESRYSPDSIVTARGRHIIQTGAMYGLQLLNGTKCYDEPRSVTRWLS
ncbi:hypothetical protein C8Q73DRAFT_789466 [Cubamyces lactineus]|nr:hypothetical protein C8Q73DRAFT_789466 [Cubamyces lactineus]